jgi:hypothetical protein
VRYWGITRRDVAVIGGVAALLAIVGYACPAPLRPPPPPPPPPTAEEALAAKQHRQIRKTEEACFRWKVLNFLTLHSLVYRVEGEAVYVTKDWYDLPFDKKDEFRAMFGSCYNAWTLLDFRTAKIVR